jgi:ubiquinone/menaquinone biosynthesis C-methylase UbiE
MHIPDVKRAVAELARVLKPGGVLVISEGNKSSLEAVFMRNLKRVLRREKAEVKDTPAGVEYWKEKDGDALVTRQANIQWLIRELDQRGVSLTTRVPGQLSESYRMFSKPFAKGFLHNLNSLWFRRVKLAGPAYGNILIFKKRDE